MRWRLFLKSEAGDRSLDVRSSIVRVRGRVCDSREFLMAYSPSFDVVFMRLTRPRWRFLEPSRESVLGEVAGEAAELYSVGSWSSEACDEDWAMSGLDSGVTGRMVEVDCEKDALGNGAGWESSWA